MNNKTIFRVCEVDKKEKIINLFYEGESFTLAKEIKKIRLQSLIQTGMLQGTLLILDSENKIIN